MTVENWARPCSDVDDVGPKEIHKVFCRILPRVHRTIFLPGQTGQSDKTAHRPPGKPQAETLGNKDCLLCGPPQRFRFTSLVNHASLPVPGKLAIRIRWPATRRCTCGRHRMLSHGRAVRAMLNHSSQRTSAAADGTAQKSVPIRPGCIACLGMTLLPPYVVFPGSSLESSVDGTEEFHRFSRSGLRLNLASTAKLIKRIRPATVGPGRPCRGPSDMGLRDLGSRRCLAVCRSAPALIGQAYKVFRERFTEVGRFALIPLRFRFPPLTAHLMHRGEIVLLSDFPFLIVVTHLHSSPCGVGKMSQSDLFRRRKSFRSNVDMMSTANGRFGPRIPTANRPGP